MKRYILKSKRLNSEILFLTITPKRAKDTLKFEPGQYVALGFKGANGRPSLMRCFSIVSSPYHPEEISFAIRILGDYTQELCRLPIESEMFIQGPFGDFRIDQRYDKNIILLAGGIGITPMMSMIRAAHDAQLPIPMTLLYTYRNGHTMPFYNELREIEAHSQYFNMVAFITSAVNIPELPRLLSGKMTARHLDQLVNGKYSGATFFLCGPKGFMQSTEQMLVEKGVDEARIIAETFTQSAQITVGNGHSIQKLTYGLTAIVLLFGIGSVTAIDLIQFVPRYMNAAALGATHAAAPSPSTTQPAGSSTGSSTATTNSSPSSSGGSNTASNGSATAASGSSTAQPAPAQQSAPAPAPQPAYQPPITSVS